jgi:hypothetical protein
MQYTEMHTTDTDEALEVIFFKKKMSQITVGVEVQYVAFFFRILLLKVAMCKLCRVLK